MLRFLPENIYLHTELSEELLERLCRQTTVEKNQISDLTLSLFDPYATRLRSARIPNANKLSIEGLSVLRGHKLVELEIEGLTKTTISDVIDECLGKVYEILYAESNN